MSGSEIFAYLLLGFFIYQVGSFVLFFRLCKRVMKDFEGTDKLPDTDNVKELIEIAGKDNVEEFYKKYKENDE